jgi:hypothetical protein
LLQCLLLWRLLQWLLQWLLRLLQWKRLPHRLTLLTLPLLH